jgi:phytoene dehydrogenase-like protein
MQGLMEPWARAIRANGGQIITDCKPVEILIEGGRTVGALGVDRHNVLLEVRAPLVLFTGASWELLELINSSALPEAFVRDARALEAYKGDLVGWQAALSRLPRLRSTGEPDEHDGWNRFLLGAECHYHGGYQIPSMTSRRAAPEGKHVLCMVMNRWLQGGSRTAQPWDEAKRALAANIDYLRQYVYVDLDDCILWNRHVYHSAPQAMTWWHGPGPRHELDGAGVDGLLLAGHTLEAPSSIGNIDMGGYVGQLAAERALELAGSA